MIARGREKIRSDRAADAPQHQNCWFDECSEFHPRKSTIWHRSTRQYANGEFGPRPPYCTSERTAVRANRTNYTTQAVQNAERVLGIAGSETPRGPVGGANVVLQNSNKLYPPLILGILGVLPRTTARKVILLLFLFSLILLFFFLRKMKIDSWTILILPDLEFGRMPLDAGLANPREEGRWTRSDGRTDLMHACRISCR